MEVNYSRARVCVIGQKQMLEFMQLFYDFGDVYRVEDKTGTQRANVKSILGLMYAMMEFGEEMYLVNLTNDGHFPTKIDKYRA